jgi:hypothetical protein
MGKMAINKRGFIFKSTFDFIMLVVSAYGISVVLRIWMLEFGGGTCDPGEDCKNAMVGLLIELLARWMLFCVIGILHAILYFTLRKKFGLPCKKRDWAAPFVVPTAFAAILLAMLVCGLAFGQQSVFGRQSVLADYLYYANFLIFQLGFFAYFIYYSIQTYKNSAKLIRKEF